MKNLLFLAVMLLILPSLVWAADDFTLSGYTPLDTPLDRKTKGYLTGYTEVGKRSTADDYEEEDTDDDYTYQNYHLKLKEEVSDRLSYDISSFIYDKDYKSRNSMDNISRIFKTNWSYYIEKIKEQSWEIDLKLKYNEKRYAHTPTSEYDQLMAAQGVSFVKKDSYSIKLSTGIDNFDYLDSGLKDQLKIFGELGGQRYFLEKKLMLASSYKLETTEHKNIGRYRTKHEIMGGFDYVFDIPWVHKITTRAEWGERDTKEEDERDEDYDFEYWRYYTKTEHRINPKLKTNLKYQYFKKDYISADLDHRGFYIQNGLDYEILDDEKKSFGLGFNAKYKDVQYILKTDNDYTKETAEIKTFYQRKKRWKALASLEGNLYDYNESTNDKRRYYALVSGEKLFLAGDLILSIDFKYRYTDYDERDDKEQEAVRLGFKYKF